MASVSGLSGHTTAIDINTRFLTGLSSGVRGVAGDIRIAALEPESFDLVHARSVLTHLPDFEVALERMLVALRQGGWLVLEEPDCTAARAIAGDKQARHSVAKVNGAILCMFSATGTDPSVGARLPGLLQKAGLKNLGVEYDAPLAQGTSEIAQMMGMSARQLQAKCLATGEATQQDIANYGKFAQSPVSWAIYYATVGVLGQRGGSNSPTQSARPRVEGTSWQ